MKKILYILYSLCAVAALVLAQGAPPITFKEVDGSPKKTAPTTIQVSNGTLTCSGSTCTITTGGGSPGGANTQVQYNNNGALGGINTFTYDGNRMAFGANPLFNVGSTGTDNLIFVGSTSPGAVNASFGFFVGGVGSQQASDGPYFLGRGNNFSSIANQRGMMFFAAGDPGTSGTNDGNILFATGAEVVRMTIRREGAVQFAGFALAALPTTPDGGTVYCVDCAVGTDPCTGSSTGSMAFRLNGRWYCP